MPTIADTKTNEGPGTGVFTSTMTGLKAGTTYYARAYATNSVGTSYGEQFSFKTSTLSIPVDGMVAYYPFSGNADDASGNGHNGIINGATLSTDKDGNINQAYSFNGSSDYLKVAGAFPVTNNFTISFWANCENTSGYNNILCDGSSDAGGNDFLINFRANNIGIRADKNNLPLNYEDSSPAQLSGLDIINKWVHVVWVMNPASSSVYLNGVLLTTINQAGTNEGYHDSHSFIGARQVWGSPDNFFKGKLDEIMIYDRPLSDMEISALYNSDGTTIQRPSITTTAATVISQTSVSTGGTIVSEGGSAITARGVCWNTTGNPTVSDEKTSDGTGTGTFTSTISGLTAGKTYYVRAYATNSDGTFYGSQVTFNTLTSSLTVPTDGLIAYYPFNGNANDESGNGVNATNYNASLTNDRFGNIDKAYSFDGNSGSERYIYSNIGKTLTLSFSVWFKTGTPVTMYPTILAYGSNNRLDITMNGNHSAYVTENSMGVVRSSSVVGEAFTSVVTSQVKYIDNNWHHLVAMFVPNDSIYLFIDNFFIAKSAYLPNSPTDDLLYIGRQINDNTGSVMHESHFNGSIDDIRIYNRKLSYNEIEQLYNEGSREEKSLIDYDGNTYNTIQIGTQTWMKENLMTTKYNDGTKIPLVTDQSSWYLLPTDAYCYYNFDYANNGSKYGAFYNWYAVNTGKLCPKNWHVPSDSEWVTLIYFLGGVSVAGGKLKDLKQMIGRHQI